MKTNEPTELHLQQLDRGAWLYELLSDVRRDVAQQPSDDAVSRIRARLEQGMEAQPAETAVRVAA